MGAKSVQLRVDSNRIRFRAELFRLRRQHSGRSDSSYDARGKYNDHDNHTDSDDNEYDSGNDDALDYDDNHSKHVNCVIINAIFTRSFSGI